MSVTITVDKRQLDKATKMTASLKDLPRRFMLNVGMVAQGEVQKNLSGRILHVRTNRLRGSIGNKLTGTPAGGTITVEVGSGANPLISGRVPYAGIHITGGVVRARPGGWLTIPTAANKTPAGVMRYTYGEWKARKGKSQKKMFYFAKKVTIPKRDYLTPAGQATVAKFDMILAASIKDIMKGRS